MQVTHAQRFTLPNNLLQHGVYAHPATHAGVPLRPTGPPGDSLCLSVSVSVSVSLTVSLPLCRSVPLSLCLPVSLALSLSLTFSRHWAARWAGPFAVLRHAHATAQQRDSRSAPYLLRATLMCNAMVCVCSIPSGQHFSTSLSTVNQSCVNTDQHYWIRSYHSKRLTDPYVPCASSITH